MGATSFVVYDSDKCEVVFEGREEASCQSAKSDHWRGDNFLIQRFDEIPEGSRAEWKRFKEEALAERRPRDMLVAHLFC